MFHRSNSWFASKRRPILCYVTDRRVLSVSAKANEQIALLEKIESLLAAGIDCIQIREKDLSARDCGSLTRSVLELQARHSSKSAIIVNDRVDVALTEKASGVHLGERSIPVAEAKKFVASSAEQADFLLGVSCHSQGAALGGESAGADYLIFGPIFATPSKAQFGAPQGILRLAEICRSVKIPVLAIGGISLENSAECLQAGAAGIAAIRLFQDAADPAGTVKALHQLARG